MLTLIIFLGTLIFNFNFSIIISNSYLESLSDDEQRGNRFHYFGEHRRCRLVVSLPLTH